MKNRVRQIMDRKGVTIQRLSKGSGISRRTIQTILNGEGSCHMETMIKLAEALDVSVAELFLQPYERIIQLGALCRCNSEFGEEHGMYSPVKDPCSLQVSRLANAAYECFQALPEEVQWEFFEICYQRRKN